MILVVMPGLITNDRVWLHISEVGNTGSFPISVEHQPIFATTWAEKHRQDTNEPWLLENCYPFRCCVGYSF